MDERFPPARIYVDIGRAETSDIGGICSILKEAFKRRDPRLAQLILNEDESFEPLEWVVKDILESHLNSRDCSFMVAYETSDGVEYEYSEMDANIEEEESGTDTDDSEESRNLTFGWIAVSLAPPAFRNVFAASEFNTYACLSALRRTQTREWDHLNIADSYSRLLHELENRSLYGQAIHINQPHLVVNALVLWPDLHEVTYWEMTFGLLKWAATFAERRGLPIWSQMPGDQREAFRQAGFTEVGMFTLNLNDYKPYGSTEDWGRQEWAQMVYSRGPGERPARSTSPRVRGGGSRRLSF